jgi:hypothetical protein
MQKRIITALVLIAVALVSNPAATSASVVTISTKKFANCTALNAVYPGGVASTATARNQGGVSKHKPTVNAKVYKENKGKDRDNDGIACEK